MVAAGLVFTKKTRIYVAAPVVTNLLAFRLKTGPVAAGFGGSPPCAPFLQINKSWAVDESPPQL